MAHGFQILPQESSLSSALGQGIGTVAQGYGSGLGQGLQALAQFKLNQAMQRHQNQDLSQAYQTSGVPQQLAQLLPFIPEGQRYQAALDFASLGQPQQDQNPTQITSAQPSQINDLTKGLFGQGNTPFLNGEQNIGSLLEQALGQNQQQLRQNPFGQQPIPSTASQSQSALQSPILPPSQPPTAGNQAPKPVNQMAPNIALLTQQQPITLRDIAQRIGQGTTKEDAVLRHALDKETAETVKEVKKAEKAAVDTEKRLGRMSELIKKGNIPNSAFYKFFKDLEEKVSPSSGATAGALLGGVTAGALRGLATGGPAGAAVGGAIGGLIGPVASLVNSGIRHAYPDTDEFEKLSADFIKDAKNIFGSRITDADLSAFLKTVPTLTQTDKGKEAIIRNMENFTEAVHVRYKSMKEILQENQGKRPYDLDDQIEERSSKKLKELSDKFVKGIAVK